MPNRQYSSMLQQLLPLKQTCICLLNPLCICRACAKQCMQDYSQNLEKEESLLQNAEVQLAVEHFRQILKA